MQTGLFSKPEHKDNLSVFWEKLYNTVRLTGGLGMNIKDAVVAALKEMVLPKLAVMKHEQAEIRTTLVLTNKRLDDINIHLADQSRRIDALREELSRQIVETNRRIDAVREELSGRITETNKRIDAVREELSAQISETNNRLNRLYEVIVRRDEHQQLSERMLRLEQDMEELKRRLAA